MDKNYMQFAGYRNYLAKSWINIVEMLAKNNINNQEEDLEFWK